MARKSIVLPPALFLQAFEVFKVTLIINRIGSIASHMGHELLIVFWFEGL